MTYTESCGFTDRLNYCAVLIGSCLVHMTTSRKVRTQVKHYIAHTCVYGHIITRSVISQLEE